MVSSYVIIKSLLIFFVLYEHLSHWNSCAMIWHSLTLCRHWIILFLITLLWSPPHEPIHKQMIHNYQLNLKELDFNRCSLSVTQKQPCSVVLPSESHIGANFVKNMRHSLSHSTCTCLSDSCWPRGNEHVDSYIQNPQSKWSWSLILKMIWSLFKMWSFKRSDQNQKKDLDLWSWSLKKWSYPSMVLIFPLNQKP